MGAKPKLCAVWLKPVRSAATLNGHHYRLEVNATIGGLQASADSQNGSLGVCAANSREQ